MSARGLDVSSVSATVAIVTEPVDELYDWIVMFRKNERRLYTYMSRSVGYMEGAIKKSYEKHGYHPYRIWVLVDGEIQKVEIS